MNVLTYRELFGEPAQSSSAASSSAASSSAAPPGLPPVGLGDALHMKIEVVLKKHQVEYSMALIDDIVMSLL
jgi:hypothetical protein